MDCKGTISTVATALCRHSSRYNSEAVSTAEEIAKTRFQAKLEQPDSKHSTARRNACWEEWVKSDENMLFNSILGPRWAKARILIHEILKDFRLDPVSFTNGSEFEPTLGFNSIESKLSRSTWTCTPDNFDLWAGTVYSHHGLKFAMRKRYLKYLLSHKMGRKLIDRKLWFHFKDKKDPGFQIFKFKLSLITVMVQGNRFSTVPKNNIVDRPICVEPLANILTQRRIGNGFRRSLQNFGYNLNTLAYQHQRVISNPKVATIDLKNASDRIHLKLVKYLFPKRIFDKIEQSRSSMTLGLDDNYYVINKVSSMGNGFTFEMMSLILLALCKSHTPECSVFGDDIIVPNSVARDVIADLQVAGFVVNMKKTHVDDTYRESCGAHYVDGYGYVESYDFRYPKSMSDVITSYNKLVRLSSLYDFFKPLLVEVYRAMPGALHADNPFKANGLWHRQQDTFTAYKLDQTTVRSSFQFRKDGLPWSKKAKAKWRRFCSHIQISPHNASLHYGFEWVDKAAAPSELRPSQWAKILMYIASGRVCKDTIKGKGTVKSYLAVTDIHGTTFRWSSVLAAIKVSGDVERLRS